MTGKAEDGMQTGSTRIRWVRVALLLCGLAALYLFGSYAADTAIAHFDLHVRIRNEPMLHRTIMTATGIYIVLMAIPFTPAAEIGLTLLMVFGAKLAFLVYVSTVAALVLAYGIGRLIPIVFAARLFDALGLTQAHTLMQKMATLSGEERLALLAQRVPRLTQHRYLSLAVLLNLPGNVIVGGGGGIAMLAGMTRLFSFPAYLLTVAIAVAPVPLIIFLAG